MRDEHRLRTTGGTGSGKDEHHFIGLAACFARIGFVFLEDLFERGGRFCIDRFVVNGDRIDRKRRNALDHGEDLIFEIGLVMEGGSNERLGFNKGSWRRRGLRR